MGVQFMFSKAFTFLVTLSIVLGAWRSEANSWGENRGCRADFIQNVRAATQSALRDISELILEVRVNSPGGCNPEEERVLRDLETLRSDTRAFQSELNFSRGDASWHFDRAIDQFLVVQRSFNRLRAFEIVKKRFRDLIETMDTMRFYYMYSQGGWNGGTVRGLATRLIERVEILYERARLQDQMEGNREGSLTRSFRQLHEAAQAFSDKLEYPSLRTHRDTSQDFAWLKVKYQQARANFDYLHGVSRAAPDSRAPAFRGAQPLPQDNYGYGPDGEYARVIELMTFLTLFYESAWDNGSGWGHGDGHIQSARTIARDIEDSARALSESIALWASPFFGGRGKQAVRRAVDDLAYEASRLARSGSRADYAEVRRAYEHASFKVRDSDLDYMNKRKMNEIGELMRRLDHAEFEFSRSRGRGELLTKVGRG